MQTLPDVYLVSPVPEPGEYGVVTFIRQVATQLAARVGPAARPLAVLGLTSAEAGTDNLRRWTMVHLFCASGAHVMFTARPDQHSTDVDEWQVYVNGRHIEAVAAHRYLRERLASVAARGLRQSPGSPPPWGPTGSTHSS